MNESLVGEKKKKYDWPLAFGDQGQENHSLVPLHGSMPQWKVDVGSLLWLGQARFQSASHAHVPSTVLSVPAVLNDTVVGRTIDPQGVHTLTPGVCGYGT